MRLNASVSALSSLLIESCSAQTHWSGSLESHFLLAKGILSPSVSLGSVHGGAVSSPEQDQEPSQAGILPPPAAPGLPFHSCPHPRAEINSTDTSKPDFPAYIFH